MSDLSGVITALATPFDRGGLDEASFARLLQMQMKGGVRGFVIAGTTGESPTLIDEEVVRLLQIARKECGREAQLIVGTGTNSTAKTIELTEEAAAAGADAALIVVPYYNRPTQKGLIEHFSAVARAVKIPQILYNVPSRTSCSLEATSVRQLAGVENIVGIKEASGDLGQLSELQKMERQSFLLLSGDDKTGVEFCRRGGHGIISVVSNLIPGPMVDMVHRAGAGEAQALADYEGYSELLHWLYVEANPIPVKWALRSMGIFKSGEMRLPMTELSAGAHEGFKACLKKLKLV